MRWGTVESVDDEHVVITSAPLTFTDGALGLGDADQERVRWRRDGTSLAPPPVPGDVVAAHWDWVCGTITDAERDALADATALTLNLVNDARNRHASDPG